MTNTAPSSGQNANSYIVLLLSLNLILLAFFILLNALSNFETQKAHAAIDSVNRAFRGSLQTPKTANSTTASLGILPLPWGMTSEVGSLFESFVPSAKAKLTARATQMTVELPAKALFRPGSHVIRPERKVLIRRLARALMRDSDGMEKYELSFEHGSIASKPQSGESATSGEIERSVRRGGTVARYLIRQGIPVTALSIGLRPETSDKVWFVLRVRGEALSLLQPFGASGANEPDTGRAEP